MLWHIMKYIAGYGFTNFILGLATTATISGFLLRYSRYTEDFQITLGKPEIKLLTPSQEATWTITFVETAHQRYRRQDQTLRTICATDEFMLTYSDVISNVDLLKLWDHHRHNGKLATITGVRPPFRYGEFVFENDEVLIHECPSSPV
jgi:glucose-1-phosphate cytidylyltransferase